MTIENNDLHNHVCIWCYRVWTDECGSVFESIECDACRKQADPFGDKNVRLKRCG